MRTRARILVVEDDPPLAAVYRSALRFAGYDVDIAGDGITALALIERNQPDLVILDLDLPRLRGEAIVSDVCDGPAAQRVPIIVVTGAEDSDLDGRVDAVLRKPCDPANLVAMVDRHLGGAVKALV